VIFNNNNSAMNDFNLQEWRAVRALRDNCKHYKYEVRKGIMANGMPIRRFICVACGKTDTSVQMDVSDMDRKISSVKHIDKTIREIAEVDMPYLLWVAVQSKMPQPDRYACARVCAGHPYTIPDDGQVVDCSETYSAYVKIAKDFIKNNT